ncbi:sensor histidine kinase [Hymenobacter sp. DG25B]|jgi:signal transduction histidine kinase|uniref:sensor histidine kinase n=1 Tax=Hymenobacter sp. DG25B TaxID=1385664 RepID=UPI00066217BD|nr:HAMP domain-containing sensor histidine kinase [Hymenobacter sp. DG25B]
MVWYLLLGFVMGAALFGGAVWWQRRLRRSVLAHLTRQVETLDLDDYQQRLVTPAAAADTAPLVRQLNQLLARRQAAFEDQRRFVVQAAHKLRTPLTSIRGQLEVTLIKPRSVAHHEETCRSVLQDIARLNLLSADLLTLAHLRAAHLTPHPVALDDVLYQASARLKARRPGYEVHFEFDPQLAELSGPLTVPGDAELLEQLCLHLLENGCKFSPHNQVRATLGLDAHHAILRFVDDGPSVVPAELPRIFEPFFMGANAHLYCGHGLGLALVQRVVQLHRGIIEVMSEPGSAFVVRLPLQ